MSESHRYFMMKALKEARQALLEEEVPIGAVLVSSEGNVLAKAHNRTIALNDPTAHAEILAIREGAKKIGNYRIEGATLYVTVEPCVMCSGSLVWARIKNLVYGARDEKGGAVDSLYRIPQDKRMNHSVEIVSGVMEKECREILQIFFQDLRSRGKPVKA